MNRLIFPKSSCRTSYRRDEQLWRCFEHGKETDKNHIRAAKYYRLATESNDADAQNNFAICLERRLGIQTNIVFASEYYERSAKQSHPNRTNNLGFCLEHDRDLEQDIELTAEYYKMAPDLDHPEVVLNCRRCLRLLDRWNASDRPSQVSSRPSPIDSLLKHVMIEFGVLS
jgi:TPR repeat protein